MLKHDVFSTAKNDIFLAPMAGVTDAAFRRICKRFGAGLTYTEMVSAKGLFYHGRRTRQLLDIHPEEGRAGVQIFGSVPDITADITKRLCDELADKIALIDINMGCPAPKIVNNGEGAALMKTPALAAKVIQSVKKASRVPVTVKFRKGYDENHVNAVAFARMAEDAGADAVCVHGRTRDQYYSGKADLDIIRDVKRAVKIPVIGNGDVFSGKDAKDMLETTGCDAVMVARGAMGNPFIFREILHYLDTAETLPPPSPKERFETLLLQAEWAVAEKGERIAIKELRKHAAWYVKGMKNAAQLRRKAVKVNTREEIYRLFEKHLDDT